MRDAVDFSYARPSGQQLADLGLDALVYTGNARPDQAYIDDLRAHGVTVTFVQETTSTRSQQGFQAGVYDCQFAEARAKERGHTGSIAVVVSDGSRVDAWDCSEYGRGWQSVATLAFFAYGSVGCCDSFNRGAPQSLGTWIPETWGAGSLLTQHVGPSPVGDSDLNTVHANYTTAPTPSPTPQVPEEDDMHIALLKTPSGLHEAMLVNGGFMDEDFGLAVDGDFLQIPAATWAWVNADPVNKNIGFRAYSVAGWNKVRGRSAGTSTNPTSFVVTSTVNAA